MISEPEFHWPVLVVEDDGPTAELESKVLQRSGKTTRIASTVAAALDALRRERFSAVLLDFILVNENGWSVLETARTLRPTTPVIVVTGRGSEEVAVEALRRGAADYVIKNGEFWEQLPTIVERVVTMAQAERLRASLATVAESSDDAIVGAQGSGAIVSWNSGATRIFGHSAAQTKDMRLVDLFLPEHRPAIMRAVEKASNGERLTEFETEGLSNDGSVLKLSVLFSPIQNGQENVPGVAMVARDISHRKRAESQLRRSEYQLLQMQKFEAIRDIAGGVAHEFNNQLTVIMVGCERIKNRLGPEHPILPDVDQIIKTGERAAMVSRNLQAFSRQQQLRPKHFNLNTALTGLQDVLKLLTGDGIQIEMRLAPQLEQIHADPVTIGEVVINLIKNAVDAMPAGGNIVIETTNVLKSDEFAHDHKFKAGRYVLLSVSDTGCGMDEATRARIFEPFFTTKGRARRAGLGLAMVYGTIKQSDGFIYVSSQPKLGSRFELYFPSVGLEALPPAPSAHANAIPPPNKTILVVDDEPDLLELVTDILESSGYTILSASGPQEAMKLFNENSDRIDLLLTDVVMPKMNGSELSKHLCGLKPALKVIFMSGHAENHLDPLGKGGIHFIAKPFTLASLKRKIQDVLGIRSTSELQIE